MKIIGT